MFGERANFKTIINVNILLFYGNIRAVFYATMLHKLLLKRQIRYPAHVNHLEIPGLVIRFILA